MAADAPDLPGSWLLPCTSVLQSLDLFPGGHDEGPLTTGYKNQAQVRKGMALWDDLLIISLYINQLLYDRKWGERLLSNHV